MTSGEIVGLVAVGVMIALGALLAAAETAITRVSSARAEALVEEGRRGASVLRNLIDRRERVLNPILLVVLGCQLGAATIVAIIVDRRWGTGTFVIVFVVELLIVYAVAEALPKGWALKHPDRSATAVAPLVRVLSSLSPLRWMANGIVDLFGAEESADEHTEGEVSEEELLALAEEAAASDAIDEDERVLIEHIIEFGDTLASEVMVPRPDISALHVDDTVNGAVGLVIDKGFSRVPVYGDGIDDVRGLIHAKDLMRGLRDGCAQMALSELMREAVFVPESKRVAQLLREMQAESFHLAIVVDEYGGTAGLVTLEDLIEEVVGEITDEFDVEQPMIEQLGDSQYRVNGRAALDDLSVILGVRLPSGEWSTVGGLLFNTLGYLPVEGEAVDVDGHRFVVERVQGRRIARVLVMVSLEGSAPVEQARS
jgi:magnesium and cobalt exporter, CNNM family